MLMNTNVEICSLRYFFFCEYWSISKRHVLALKRMILFRRDMLKLIKWFWCRWCVALQRLAKEKCWKLKDKSRKSLSEIPFLSDTSSDTRLSGSQKPLNFELVRRLERLTSPSAGKPGDSAVFKTTIPEVIGDFELVRRLSRPHVYSMAGPLRGNSWPRLRRASLLILPFFKTTIPEVIGDFELVRRLELLTCWLRNRATRKYWLNFVEINVSQIFDADF